MSNDKGSNNNDWPKETVQEAPYHITPEIHRREFIEPWIMIIREALSSKLGGISTIKCLGNSEIDRNGPIKSDLITSVFDEDGEMCEMPTRVIACEHTPNMVFEVLSANGEVNYVTYTANVEEINSPPIFVVSKAA